MKKQKDKIQTYPKWRCECCKGWYGNKDIPAQQLHCCVFYGEIGLPLFTSDNYPLKAKMLYCDKCK